MTSSPNRSLTPSPSLPLVVAPLRDPEAELAAFWNGRTISLVVACSCAIIVSGIAVALLFTPIGAGVVTTGLLIGSAAITGPFGFGSLLAVLITHSILKEEVAEIAIQRAQDQALEARRNSASESLFAVIRKFGDQIIREKMLFVCPSPKQILNKLRRELPTDFPDHTYDHPPLLANYLKSLFLPRNNEPLLISLKLKNFGHEKWVKFNQDSTNEANREFLIEDLQTLFSETPRSAIYFILLLHATCSANQNPSHRAWSLALHLNPLLQIDLPPLSADESTDTNLAHFIIIHADQIFVDAHRDFKQSVEPKDPIPPIEVASGTDSEDD